MWFFLFPFANSICASVGKNPTPVLVYGVKCLGMVYKRGALSIQ